MLILSRDAPALDSVWPSSSHFLTAASSVAPALFSVQFYFCQLKHCLPSVSRCLMNSAFKPIILGEKKIQFLIDFFCSLVLLYYNQ